MGESSHPPESGRAYHGRKFFFQIGIPVNPVWLKRAMWELRSAHFQSMGFPVVAGFCYFAMGDGI
jgi:hypothetical protein